MGSLLEFRDLNFILAAYLQIDYPMVFELNNPSAGKITHCGVLEFTADEGLIYLPYWVGGTNIVLLNLLLTCEFLLTAMLSDDGKHDLTRGRHSAY